jgi:DNA methylase
MNAAGLIERQYLIWVKPGNVLGHADYQWQHEPCFYASKGNTKPTFYGDRAQSTVWHVQAGGNAGDVAATIGNGILILDGKGGKIYVQSSVPKNRKIRQLRLTNGVSAHLSGSDRKDGTVWEVARDMGCLHPTQKPVELARRAMQNSSKEGELVLDCFLGSGTTLVAAELLRRRCYAIELDPIYAQVAIERWERVSGKKATMDDKTLDEVKRERTGNAAGDTRKSISRNKPERTSAQSAVRKGKHVGRAKKRGKPARQSPAVARHT